MYTLDPTATSEFWVTGSAGINMPGCALYDDSSSSTALKVNGTLMAAWIGVVGSYTLGGTGTVTPTPTTGIAPIADPLAWLPEPTVSGNCNTSIKITGGTHTVSPGCYSDLAISGSSTNVLMSPGTYVINGNANTSGSGTITGSGITLFVTGGGTASISGSGSLSLSAPLTGTYNGVLLFQSRSDNNAVSVSGSSGNSLKGIIYCSKAPLNFTGSSGEIIYTDLIAATVKASGTFNLYSYATINPNAPIQRATLAE